MTTITLPDWFLLIREWRTRNMGEVGITLPFLVGALAINSGNLQPSVKDIRGLLREIASEPVNEYFTEVRWCPNVQAPVLSVVVISAESLLPFKNHFLSSSGQPSLGFSQNIQSMLGLNCAGTEGCLEALALDAAPHVEVGTYSRLTNPKTWEREYGQFTEGERQFIIDTIKVRNATGP